MKNRTSVVCLTSFALALGLAGCATRDAAWVHENLHHTENFHAGSSVLETPRFPDTGPHIATLRATARTRGSRVGADIELAVRAQFPDYSFLDRVSFSSARASSPNGAAAFPSGRAYPIVVEKREVDDCGTTDASLCDVHEYVAVGLSRNFLQSKRASGFSAKFWGRRDSVVIRIPPEYIEGLLAKMENRAPMIPTASASPESGSVPAAPAP